VTSVGEPAGLQRDHRRGARLRRRAAGLALALLVPGLAGCGLLIVNPPWTLTGTLAGLLPTLARLLAQGAGATFRLESLVGE